MSTDLLRSLAIRLLSPNPAGANIKLYYSSPDRPAHIDDLIRIIYQRSSDATVEVIQGTKPANLSYITQGAELGQLRIASDGWIHYQVDLIQQSETASS